MPDNNRPKEGATSEPSCSASTPPTTTPKAHLQWHGLHQPQRPCHSMGWVSERREHHAIRKLHRVALVLKQKRRCHFLRQVSKQ